MIAGSDRKEDGKPASPVGRRSIWSIIIPLLPYAWSRERPDLQWRVIVALLLLLATKLVTLAISLRFKLVTDVLAGCEGRPPAGLPWLVWLVAAPVPIVVAYCVARVMESSLTQ